MGSNMAEAHPVGFRWVMKARERGAKVIHVDPRLGRTGASADLHVPIRPGTDIAFLGGLIRHVIDTGSYDRSSWMYDGGEIASASGVREHSTQAFDETTGAGLLEGAVKRDPTL